jgi:hypothetical protein
MPRRNEDGTFRNHHKVKTPSDKTIRARWTEAEVLRLKDEHLKTEAIANHITQVGRGQRQPLVPFPSGITFPPNFSFTHQAVSKAYNRAVDRIPKIDAQRLVKQIDRDLENTLCGLAPGVHNGDPRAANASTRVRELLLKTHGGLRGGTNIQVNTEVKTYADKRPKPSKQERTSLFQNAARIMRELEGYDDEPLPKLIPDQTPIEREAIETTASKLEEPSPQASNGKDESPSPTEGEPGKTKGVGGAQIAPMVRAAGYLSCRTRQQRPWGVVGLEVKLSGAGN